MNEYVPGELKKIAKELEHLNDNIRALTEILKSQQPKKDEEFFVERNLDTEVIEDWFQKNTKLYG